MGVRLIVEVLDHWQDLGLTAGERGDLIIVAENANDRTRRTYGSLHQPHILKRAGKTAAGWKNALGKLMRKGVLAYVVEDGRELSGFPGRHAEYRIPQLCPQGSHSGHLGQCAPPETGHPSGDPMREGAPGTGHLAGDPMNETDHGTGHLAGGNGSPDRWERVTPQVTPTPPTPLTPPTSGDGRRPTTGSRACGASGSAALGEIEGQVRFADLRRVIAALPPPLVAALEAEHSAGLPTSITDAIEAELRRGLTAEQMAARINKRWNLHGYALDADTAYGGRGLQRPVGVAVALVRRGDCTHPRCNDGTDLDTGEACRTCERTRQDFHAERAAAPPTLRPVPHTGPRDPSPPSGVPGQMPMLLAVQDDGEHDQKQPDDLPRCAGCGKPLLRPGRPTHVGCA